MRVQSIVNYGWHEAGWAMPWSAAFISWLACEAGWSTEQFRRSGGHYDYVRAAVRARDGEDPGPRVRRLRPGRNRARSRRPAMHGARRQSTFASIADVRGGSSDSLALHCDLVVKTDAEARRLYAIGGNVNHAVTLSVIATDAQGPPADRPRHHRRAPLVRGAQAAPGRQRRARPGRHADGAGALPRLRPLRRFASRAAAGAGAGTRCACERARALSRPRWA